MISKRLLDISISLFTLILLSPVLITLGLLGLIVMGRPVLFVQDRPGFKGKSFRLYKFRTMRILPEGGIHRDGERLTRYGRWLRSTSLDELPELWNIFRGDMSLVGPRPLLMEYLGRYSNEQARRHDVKPGLTGWAQVNGRNAITWEEKFKLDVWYVDNHDFWLDIKIIIKTFVRVIKKEGVSSPGEATMKEFWGSGEKS